ncbi:MAG: hypothetical protein EHM37_20910 [Deltaproteobacteria bacterium]|nr:MAG: hypothetical protein EHM37_20910 [Deltaproteobacteria bacterium]
MPFSLDAAIPIYMPTPLTFTIADIPVTLQWHPPISGVSAPAAYQPFLSTGRSDIRLELLTGEPQRGEEAPVFDSAPIWSLYRMRDGRHFIFSIPTPISNAPCSYRMKAAVRASPSRQPTGTPSSGRHSNC